MRGRLCCLLPCLLISVTGRTIFVEEAGPTDEEPHRQPHKTDMDIASVRNLLSADSTENRHRDIVTSNNIVDLSENSLITLDPVETQQFLSFMRRYGYLPELEGPSSVDFSYTPHSVAEAVRRLQAFAGLTPSGVIDDDTKKLFKKRRCGVSDIMPPSTRSRRRRYVTREAWNMKNITYRVRNGASTLEKHRVEKQMAAALEVWAPHGGLTFTLQDSGKADIEVSFVTGDHGDGSPFDGPGQVVAHAFCPPHGDIHFDNDEIWSESADSDIDEDSTDFFAAAVHEIGHSLGLAHSAERASVMYPYYRARVQALYLDDILGMHELYLKDQVLKSAALTVQTEDPTAPRYSLEPELADEDTPDLCYTNFDTMQVLQGKIYVFEEEWMWVLSERRELDPGYPKRFHDVFVGLPKHVTVVKTIYEKRNGNIIIFSGRQYWEFSPSFRLVKRGKLRDYGLPGRLRELTTAFLSNYNNKTYLIEYERFWRFDEDTWTMDKGYPKSMSAWRDLPYPVDSALIWKGDTYFFRGPRFWRFDNGQIRVHGYYPLFTAQIWLPCGPSPDMQRYTRNED